VLDPIETRMGDRRELICGLMAKPAPEADDGLYPIGCGKAGSPIFCIPGSERAPQWRGLRKGRIERCLASALIAVLALGLLAGCGKRGAPMVPRTRDPLPIMDLKAVPRGGAVTLYFTLPSENMDGTPFRDLTRVEVFRIARSGPDEARDTSMLDKLLGKRADKAKLLLSVEESELVQGKNLLGRSVRLVDSGEGIAAPEDWFGNVFEYFVFTHGRRWRKSPPSNLAKAMPLLGPKPPEQVATEVGDSVVKIAWQPQTWLTNGAPLMDAACYNVYRAPKAGWQLKGPINEELITDCSYVDYDVVNDIEYRYAVTTVAIYGELFAESATSATVSATPADHIAPSAPYGLEAVSGQGIVNLLWTADEAPDHLGYRVHRKKTGDDSFTLLTPEPIIRTTFVDRAVFPNVEYSYCVTAVDNSSSVNESGPSNLVTAKPR